MLYAAGAGISSAFPCPLPAPTPVPPVQPALPALRPILPASEADHGLRPGAAGPQPSLPRLCAGGEELLGKGDTEDLGPRQEGGLQSLTPDPLPWQWCEKHKRSGRQMLGDLLIKPHQRITKYPLLLQAVLKRTPKPQAREALTAMVEG